MKNDFMLQWHTPYCQNVINGTLKTNKNGIVFEFCAVVGWLWNKIIVKALKAFQYFLKLYTLINFFSEARKHFTTDNLIEYVQCSNSALILVGSLSLCGLKVKNEFSVHDDNKASVVTVNYSNKCLLNDNKNEKL
ncbi:CLUMA_CG018767, isoform A [Clunio marinus]|uniref:CLUMA_CG018767, isoform A n=1 Tax=Clunio marinus TaxID=568069 RepID=A0A1J1J1C7_9DIPT|nr:CLUMA_CG018767, isoform A [Clunio marinus]